MIMEIGQPLRCVRARCPVAGDSGVPGKAQVAWGFADHGPCRIVLEMVERGKNVPELLARGWHAVFTGGSR